MANIRTLKPHEINLRIKTIDQKGCSLLPYVSARAAMNIMDESFGVLDWKREHLTVNNMLYCKVSVYNHTIGEWVSKEDVGTESNTDKEKGQSSDAFKRALVNFGVARELYTSPYIYIPLQQSQVNFNQSTNKYRLNYGIKFSVSKIEYDDLRQITCMQIVNNENNVVFNFDNKQSQSANVASNTSYNNPSSYIETMPSPNHYNAPPEKSTGFGATLTTQSSSVSESMPALHQETHKALTLKQINRLYAIGHTKNVSKAEIDTAVLAYYKKPISALEKSEYEEICDFYGNLPLQQSVNH